MPTKKVRKSQKRSARAPGSSNSQDARSRTTAGQKSSSEKQSVLKLRSPRDTDWLAQRGVVVPDELDPSTENLRLDFTSISSREVGAIHSRLCNRLAHALYVRAELETKALSLQRMRHLAEARYRVQREGDFKTMKTLEAAMSLSDPMKKLSHRLLKLEIRAVALDAVIKGYESIIRAASREMSRRGIEQGNSSRD